ncbi:hypothetical protein A9Q89_12840, partial [Gammaproteobacteria bacterium 53_120_T64]
LKTCSIGLGIILRPVSHLCVIHWLRHFMGKQEWKVFCCEGGGKAGEFGGLGSLITFVIMGNARRVL